MSMRIVKVGLAALGFIILANIATPMAAHASTPTGTQSSSGSKCVAPTILGLPVWYKGLVDDDCSIKDPGSVGLSTFIWRIVLNIIDIALRLVGYICVGFLLYGGFIYITSTGSADGTARAKKTITNAIVGLVISIASVGIVNVVAGAIQ